MMEFIMSDGFAGFAIITLIVLGIAYFCIVMLEEYLDDDFNEIIESRCLKCARYNTCKKHGYEYKCEHYIPKDRPVKKGGVNK